MRDPARIPLILEAVRKVWEQNPDLRLGQIIVNATSNPHSCQSIFTTEDEVLLKGLANLDTSLPGTRRISAEELQATSHDLNEKFGSVFEALASGDTQPKNPNDHS